MSAEPILIDCEGSGCPTNDGYCQMCGKPVVWLSDGKRTAQPHVRRDVLAMIERGDFDD